ncbi:lytic transglycosylase domain-containing protein [Rhodoblastus acidophilus]|uniref:Lytic transglycosylase domain-containing protein n=1 Tax=Candidatus Rhodoblastus alkanivorans TaxID=2954117 RepID=A0ABS9ZB55_9HYPH|nr:lytic transglycosylase domain-containing protein [Candidatus Rhodoblastus alkanivorans]MCI4677217.1 lytic transglycosylase domain-containing protein [Candidatus Rhodoblastus alkanivorans]MCI4684570.1 lytic transglycosylase domain-containing protein [Candidatus Rhodoblastus alkanivorans]MDI4641891.1 lytic transglycosylase domain-containing protein [Rhodoblastus acidophilus]
MTQSLPRLTLFAAIALAGSAPARAAPPKHPPLPPERPLFLNDPPAMPADPEAVQAAPPNAVTPQGVYREASLDGSSSVAEYAPAPAAASTPFGGLVVPGHPAPPPIAPARQAAVVPPPVAEGPYDPRPPQENVPAGFDVAERAGLAEMTRKYAMRNGVPLALIHRVIMRESKYCPQLIGRHRYYGLMQITPATARSMGYRGSAKGLLDAETNLKYASAYLANAWALSGGDMDRAVRLYAAGYYYTAKSKNMLSEMRDASSPPVQPTEALALAPPPAPPRPANIFEAMFGGASR